VYGSLAGSDAGPISSRAVTPSRIAGRDTFGTIEDTPGIAAAAVRKLASAGTTKVPISGYAATIEAPSGAIPVCRSSAVSDVLVVTTSQLGAVALLSAAGMAATRSAKQYAGLMVESSRPPVRDKRLHDVSAYGESEVSDPQGGRQRI
jgi:hypothetical protein